MRTAASPPTTGHHGQDQDPDQDGRPFQVIVRPTPFAVLVVGFAILATTGGVLAIVETWAAQSMLARLWGLGWGLLLTGLFGGGAIVWLGQLIGRRPVLIFDEQGVRLPAAWHRTEPYANNHIEADHGRLKARLRPISLLPRRRGELD